MAKDKPDFGKTMNLPKTDFPMKADLARKETEFLARWDEMRLYEKIQAARSGRRHYILHDGPPYANGHIHIGTALNKILKDFVVKSKAMEGYAAPYVPGWDCHGLPIEHQVLKELGPKRHGMSQFDIRRLCREYAEKFIDIQRSEFKRLGGVGDWEHPYLTMTYDYESDIVREFGKVVKAGGVYRAKKPVLWCPNDETALAEAEVDYDEHTSPSIYVKFPVADPKGKFAVDATHGTHVVIWTTTPWTLVANKAISVHPHFTYRLVDTPKGRLLLVQELVDSCMQAFGFKGDEYRMTAGAFSGTELEGILCRHPWLDLEVPVIVGDHVTREQGTGCVHTAPGHGQEDYEIGRRYGLEVYAPVDYQGRFEAGVDRFGGKKVFEANPEIIRLLDERGMLLREEPIRHSYPHCWRCKKPVIFRATEQWFISMEKNDLRKRAIEEIDRTTWIPAWGRDRIYGMMESRPDWCISRQRIWGVPIVAFACAGCGELMFDPEVVEHVAGIVSREGTDAWFVREAKDLLPPGRRCGGCGGGDFRKERDILDVWFESGVSHAAVLKRRPELSWPADLYLEGSDQHRGWFHSTLLASLQTDGRAPYKAVLTHGFVVDGSGKKMSKSAGNVIAPQEVIKQYGAEILRLWVAATDFREDIRISREIISHLVEAYRKIRNTARFLLGNLYDYDPETKAVPDEALREIDRFMLHRLGKLTGRVRKAYADFEFHLVFHSINQFCAVDLSALYLDIVKDRLYTMRPDDPDRRAAQRVIHDCLVALIRLMAPVLSFTAEEIWGHLPAGARPAADRDAESVHLLSFPEADPRLSDESLAGRWERLLAVRAEVSRVLEGLRNRKVIGSSLDAEVSLYAGGDWLAFLKPYEAELPSIFIVSGVELLPRTGDLPGGAVPGQDVKDLAVAARPARGTKCARCWHFRESVGSRSGQPLLCGPCAEAVAALP
jgi:isoleucyl-tRNA synthetase